MVIEKRPSLDEYFMELAFIVSKRSTCLRHENGAVLVKNKHVLSTGYNGSPSGLTHCKVVGCLRNKNRIPSGQRHELCRGVHAESNAIIQAALHGVSTEGATMYTTQQPCSLCTKMIINANITEIIYLEPYPDKLSSELLEETEIKVRTFDGKLP